MLSRKSDQEIVWMLDDYGIKHGPVVGSTRLLYEKKLRDVMAKERKTRGAPERVGYRQHCTSCVCVGDITLETERRAWSVSVYLFQAHGVSVLRCVTGEIHSSETGEVTGEVTGEDAGEDAVCPFVAADRVLSDRSLCPGVRLH
ncbi:uncharacterized protein Hap1MRO34_010781 isoform 2-T3 [Clarias gariepinus]